MRAWKIRGTRRGKMVEVIVQAENINAAIAAGSNGPHMLAVCDCVLVQ